MICILWHFISAVRPTEFDFSSAYVTHSVFQCVPPRAIFCSMQWVRLWGALFFLLTLEYGCSLLEDFVGRPAIRALLPPRGVFLRPAAVGWVQENSLGRVLQVTEVSAVLVCRFLKVCIYDFRGPEKLVGSSLAWSLMLSAIFMNSVKSASMSSPDDP